MTDLVIIQHGNLLVNSPFNTRPGRACLVFSDWSRSDWSRQTAWLCVMTGNTLLLSSPQAGRQAELK